MQVLVEEDGAIIGTALRPGMASGPNGIIGTPINPNPRILLSPAPRMVSDIPETT